MRPAIAYKGGSMSKKPLHELREEAEIDRWASLVLYWRLVKGLSMADAWEAANEEAELLGPVVLAVPPPPASHVRPLEGIRDLTESPTARRLRIDDEHAKRRLEGVEHTRDPREPGKGRQSDEERLAKQRAYDRARAGQAKWRWCSRCGRMMKGHSAATCPNREARRA